MSIRKRTDREYAAHLQGTLDLLILRTLVFGAQHGQAIARAIQSQSDNVLIVDHGSLYPALQRLEEREFIEASWGTSENNRKARFYTLTRKGRKELVREEGEWRRIAAAIMRVLGPFDGPDHGSSPSSSPGFVFVLVRRFSLFGGRRSSQHAPVSQRPRAAPAPA